MRTAIRIFSIVLTGLVALAAVVLIAVNLYVQSQGTQARIQQELSQRLGTPLNIRRISVTPWGGLKLTGITIPQTLDPEKNFLDAKTFRLRIRYLSLFRKPLVIKEVSLVKAKVVWPQNAAGKWRLPGVAENTDSDLAAAPPASGVHPPVASGATPPVVTSAEPPVAPRETAGESFVPEVRRVNLTGGSFHFVDNAGRDVAAFDGVEFRSNFRTAQALRGDARIAKVSLRNKFFLDELKSPIRYDPRQLEFSNISARVGGGSINGRFQMQQQTEGSPFTASVQFRDVQADEIIANAGGPRGMLRGRLEGKLDATGKTADPDALSGAGEIVLHDGQVQQYSLLVALGQVLQIEELTQLHLQQAHVKYHVVPSVVVVDELVLQSPNIRVVSSGTIKFNGKMRLSSDLIINDKMRSQLFKPLREKFQPTEQPDRYALDFQISGTVEKPKSNLVDKLVGRDLKDITSAIGSFLGRGKERRNTEERADPTASPVESPTSSPEPTVAPPNVP